MRKFSPLLHSTAALCLVGTALGQQTVTTPAGNSGSVPVFSGSSTLASSAISDTNGSVTVAEPLVVYGDVTSTAGGNINFNHVNNNNGMWWYATGDSRWGSIWRSSSNGRLYIDAQDTTSIDFGVASSNNVGIGTDNPMGELSIVTSNAASETGAHILNTAPDGFSVIRLGVDGIAAAGSVWHQFNAQWGGDPASAWGPLETNFTAFEAGGLSLATYNPSASLRFFTSGVNSGNERMRIDAGGNVGVGTMTPTQRLEVSGNVKLSGTGAGIFFPGNTTPQTVPWTGSLYGQDYADSVDVSGDRAQYTPGDVLIIDVNSPRHFLKSTKAYSTLAAGVYSTKPGVVGRRRQDLTAEAIEVPLAMVGIVPTKVSTENGPVSAGDLLVTSSTPGYAMKGTDRGLLVGAVLGKALGDLPSGMGVIDVLISLQ